jgi:hypothetical protein
MQECYHEKLNVPICFSWFWVRIRPLASAAPRTGTSAWTNRLVHQWLSDLTPSVGEHFERAFSQRHQSQRPTAESWIQCLEELEQSLTGCSANRLHHFSREASHRKGLPSGDADQLDPVSVLRMD